MRILSLTAGAGQMYCGSCLRDNALAAELLARGHDVMLQPVYTPTLTDEANVSGNHVLMGGISVYLAQKVPLFRHTPKWLDRMWDAPGVIRAATKRAISTDPHMLGDMTVSMLRGEGGAFQKEMEKLTDWLALAQPPDLTVLPNSLLISLAAPIARATRRPVGVTLQGEDLFLDGLEEPYRTESLRLIREHAASVDGFFAVSRFYAPVMARLLDIEPSGIHVIPLGITTRDIEPRGPRGAAPPRIGFFGRIAPEKGLHVLCDAYRVLRESGRLPQATLDAGGYLAPEHRAYLEGIEQRMKGCGLATEFRYHGALDRTAKLAFLRSLDVFSMPATYEEPKALSVIEALATGVPVVQPRLGAFTEIVENTGGGLLVAPNDVEALAGGIARVLQDPVEWAHLSAAGGSGARTHYSIGREADRALEVYAAIAGTASQDIPPRARPH
jgi:glycosyltransferase involved in cell wall biosynthesis